MATNVNPNTDYVPGSGVDKETLPSGSTDKPRALLDIQPGFVGLGQSRTVKKGYVNFMVRKDLVLSQKNYFLLRNMFKHQFLKKNYALWMKLMNLSLNSTLQRG